MLTNLRRAFYNADGPYRRARLAERLGSERWSRPALHGMDRRLEQLVDRDGGVFLEAGAHDGFTQSNTYYLERFRGWSGVLVEPIPELAAKARDRRPRSKVKQAALVGPEQAGDTVEMRFADLMSGIGGEEAPAIEGRSHSGKPTYEVDVPACTLDEVLTEAGVGAVDVMVLDLEGHELDALRGLDLDRHRVGFLVVEMLDLDEQRPDYDDALSEMFLPAGSLSPWDALYRPRK